MWFKVNTFSVLCAYELSGGSLFSVNSDSGGLGQGLKFFMSNQPTDDAGATSP